MNTCVALVGAYLRFNGYVTVPEQPVLVGEGKPYRYHTATDIDILAVRFPNAAVVVPRAFGTVDDDLHLDIDNILDLEKDTVDVLVGEVKSGRPRLNEGLREKDVLYATLRRVDPGFDSPLDETIDRLIRNGEARTESSGKRWRFRLVAFGEGQPALDGGPFMVVQLRHVARFLMQTMREHHEVWKDAQFGDAVLDILHLFDKMGFEWTLTPKEAEAPKEEEADIEKKLKNQNGSPKKQVRKTTKKEVSAEERQEQRRKVEVPVDADLREGAPISLRHSGRRNNS